MTKDGKVVDCNVCVADYLLSECPKVPRWKSSVSSSPKSCLITLTNQRIDKELYLRRAGVLLPAAFFLSVVPLPRLPRLGVVSAGAGG